MRKNTVVLGTLGAGLLLGACDRDGGSPTEARSPGVHPYVSEQLAKQLTPEGRFRLAPAKAPDDIPIITPDRARELARAYLRTWGRDQAARWSWERGARVDVGAIAPSSRVYFAHSAQGRLPDDLYHPAIRRIYGPMYQVPLEAGGEVVALLSISAYSTDLEIDKRGLVVSPPLGGSYFFSKAVAPSPRDPRFRFEAVTPEAAAKQVSERTGARVTELPELVLMPGYHPSSARWRVKLDRAVQVRRVAAKTAPGAAAPPPDPAPLPVQELYVGPNSIFTVADGAQPSSTRVLYPTGPGPRNGAEPTASRAVQRRGSLPLSHQRVSLDGEGA
jgi:hypothetical protein